MRVSQTGRGNFPQILHATGPCPSAFALSFSANSVPRILQTHEYCIRSLGHWVQRFFWSRKFASNFARNRPLPQSANSVAWRNQGPMSTRLSQPRALGWEVLSGLMTGNDYEIFPNWSRKFASNFARNRPLPQCIRLVFFSILCSTHFAKSGTHEY